MQTKYYIDTTGAYVGAYCGVEPPTGALEVESAPDDARQLWLFPGWSPVPITVPQEVTRFQARAALYQAGLLDGVESLIAAPEADRMLVLAWQDALTFKRHSSFVQAMAQQLSLGESQLDELFISASNIE